MKTSFPILLVEYCVKNFKLYYIGCACNSFILTEIISLSVSHSRLSPFASSSPQSSSQFTCFSPLAFDMQHIHTHSAIVKKKELARTTTGRDYVVHDEHIKINLRYTRNELWLKFFILFFSSPSASFFIPLDISFILLFSHLSILRSEQKSDIYRERTMERESER